MSEKEDQTSQENDKQDLKENKLQQEGESNSLGTIISTPDSPNSENFKFVLNRRVNRGQFVEFDIERGIAISRVEEVKKANRYFQEAESVSEYEKKSSLSDVFPTDDWEFLIGEAKILGVFNDGLIERPAFPPSPGTDVRDAKQDRLADFLGLDRENGLTIGNVQFQDVEASLNLTKLFQKHLAVLAKSGAGKSYLAAVLLEELMDRKQEEGQIAAVVMDPHGEYAGFAQDEQYMNRVTVVDADDIQLAAASLTSNRFSRFFPDVRQAQKRALDQVIADLRQERKDKGGNFTLTEIKDRIERRDMNNRTRDVLLTKLDKLDQLNLFKGYNNPALEDVKAGKTLIFDLSSLHNFRKKQIIVDQFARRFFKARRSGRIPPFFLLVEEAHNFAPEGTKKARAISRSIITNIAREGRKFHASLGLISQRPAGLSTTALSQCNTHIFLRVTNPYDLQHIEQSSEGITAGVKKMIPGLRVGEAIAVGEAVNYPTLISIRERRSEEFSTGKSLEEVARSYSQQEEQEKDDLDAFM